MTIDLDDDALAFGRVVRDAIGAAGGDDLVQRAEADAGTGDTLLDDVLAPLGLWDLDPRASGEEAEAAAAACRAAGWWAAPGSISARLARPRDIDGDALCVVAGPRPAAPVHASPLRWVAVDLDGNRSTVSARALHTSPRKAAFICDVDLSPLDDAGGGDAVLALVLGSWTLLGMLDRTMALTVGHVQDRQQFGKPLSAFQAVQFQLTEAEVERAGVEMLARYALWSLETGRPEALDDALALRVAAIEGADVVFRICHQLHGAIGFCDETTISWISRYSQPLRRLPMPLSSTRAELVRRAGRRGLTGLYSPP